MKNNSKKILNYIWNCNICVLLLNHQTIKKTIIKMRRLSQEFKQKKVVIAKYKSEKKANTFGFRRQKDEIVSQIINSYLPNWGGFKLILV